MGDVFLAEHKDLGTKVAIKSLHSNLVHNKDFRKRFRREAKLHAKLIHPNIVRLLDYHEKRDSLYLIMEYAKGKALNEYIQKVSGPIPEQKLIPLFLQLLSAVDYAHKNDLIHRDIKPSNIIIHKNTIKILDFGVATLFSEDVGLTKTGSQIGTVSYMSPEQVNAEKVDFLTDIYSLGVTLFQMAVGKAPYSTTNAFKIQLKIVSKPFPDPKDIYPSVSDKLSAIIYKATQKKKKNRYQNCSEFIKDLESKSVEKRNFRIQDSKWTRDLPPVIVEFLEFNIEAFLVFKRKTRSIIIKLKERLTNIWKNDIKKIVKSSRLFFINLLNQLKDLSEKVKHPIFRKRFNISLFSLSGFLFVYLLIAIFPKIIYEYDNPVLAYSQHIEENYSDVYENSYEYNSDSELWSVNGYNNPYSGGSFDSYLGCYSQNCLEIYINRNFLKGVVLFYFEGERIGLKEIDNGFNFFHKKKFAIHNPFDHLSNDVKNKIESISKNDKDIKIIFKFIPYNILGNPIHEELEQNFRFVSERK